MKTRMRLVALVVAALVLLSGAAAWADDGFFVVAVGGGVGTKITSVPYIIDKPGFYYLTGNLTYPSAGNAITVTADNVTLDLMGFKIVHTGPATSTGISSANDNIEIRNGTVSGFDYGIDLTSPSSPARVINIRACYNAIGIHVYSGTISGCTAANNSNFGFQLEYNGSLLNNVGLNNTNVNFYVGALGGGACENVLLDRNTAGGATTVNFVAHIGGLLNLTSNNAGFPTLGLNLKSGK